jgi:hypothetical protein
MKRCVVLLLLVALSVSVPAVAQDSAGVWRTFAQKLEIGTEMEVRLQDGKRFRAVLLEAREDAVILQPKTRVPVPVQAVPYSAVTSLQPKKDGGIGAGKAAAIGVGTGVGAFFGMLLILFAAFAD